MRWDAWMMLIVGCVILYGGLWRALYIAYKWSKKPHAPDEDEEVELPHRTF